MSNQEYLSRTVEIKKLPSLWQIGDSVSVIFPGSGTLKPCWVIKVAFDERNTLYDVEVPYNCYGEDGEPMKGVARIHGLKEWHLRNPE